MPGNFGPCIESRSPPVPSEKSSFESDIFQNSTIITSEPINVNLNDQSSSNTNSNPTNLRNENKRLNMDVVSGLTAIQAAISCLKGISSALKSVKEVDQKIVILNSPISDQFRKWD